MKLNKKLISIASGVSLLLSTGLGLTSNQSTVQAQGGELNIVFSGSPQIHERQFIMNDYLATFENETGVTVNVDFISQADAITRIQTEQETGNHVTDIVYVDTANMAPYVNNDWMQDITEFVNPETSFTDMFDESTNRDDTRLFVPNSFDVYVTAANVQAIPYLPEGLTEDDVIEGLTWEEYAEWAGNIAEGEGVGKTMIPSNLTDSQLLYPMAGMSLAYGGAFPDVSSEGFKSAMEIIKIMAENEAFYPEQNQYTAATDPMNAGNVWLTFGHMAPLGVAYSAAPNDWIIGAAPTGIEGKGSTSGAWTWGIPNGAPNQEAAEQFINYVTTAEVNYNFASNFGGVLSPIKEVEEFLEGDDVIMQAGLNMLDDTIISGVPSTEYADWNAVKLIYGEVFEQILNSKEVPSDEELQAYQARIDELKLP